MILSAYRNPPYRSPAPKPPLNHSDRAISHHEAPDPGAIVGDTVSHTTERLPTPAAAARLSSRHEPEDAGTGANSPRSAVAERFRDLDLRHHDLSERLVSPGKRKRAWNMSPQTASDGQNWGAPSNPGATNSTTVTRGQSPEIPESSPESNTGNHALDNGICSGTDIFSEQESLSEPPRKHHCTSQNGVTSSPTALASTNTDTDTIRVDHPNAAAGHLLRKQGQVRRGGSTLALDDVVDRAASPGHSHRLEDEDSALRAALTWQDDEITGYDVDPNMPDDDGEGINGIGFRPTPAVAHARSQKRRQQVHEWRAREAREARQRRMDRRRGAKSTPSTNIGVSKRMVRFAPGGS